MSDGEKRVWKTSLELEVGSRPPFLHLKFTAKNFPGVSESLRVSSISSAKLGRGDLEYYLGYG